MIAIWQSRAQHKNGMDLYKLEQRHARLALAKTLSVLAKNCAKVVAHSTEKLNDRATLHKVATGDEHFDFDELLRIDNAIAGIPLYSLPDTLITFTMIIASTVRQFRQKVETALRLHREMNADAFAELFSIFSEMNKSIAKTCNDIDAEVLRVQKET